MFIVHSWYKSRFTAGKFQKNIFTDCLGYVEIEFVDVFRHWDNKKKPIDGSEREKRQFKIYFYIFTHMRNTNHHQSVNPFGKLKHG